MTPSELYRKMLDDIGNTIEKPLTSPYLVDAETYANVTQQMINYYLDNYDTYEYREGEDKMRQGMVLIHLIVGPNKGIIFKGVEILMKPNEHKPNT